MSVELLQTQRGGKCYPFSKSFIVVARARAIDKWVIRTGDLFAVQRQVMLEGCLLMASIKYISGKHVMDCTWILETENLGPIGQGEVKITFEASSLNLCRIAKANLDRLRG